ncbi:hypothetical protein AHiyo1_32840 [Arthrobacter sp. Hiyo1]|nr:hypothetical protein AHiyo1_32840 [Arthrobacter sp. Hiyo1]
MTGTETASTTWGTSAMVPTSESSGARRKETRCPPASIPVATMASTPPASKATASSTVVAVPTTTMPFRRACSMTAPDGTPNTKLSTAGRASMAAWICSCRSGR